MTHVHKAKQLGVYGKDLVHNPDDKSFEGFIPEEQPYQIDFLDDFEIEYCKNCDFLYQSKDILAWTNDKDAKLNNMLGTGEDFILTEYNQKKLS